MSPGWWFAAGALWGATIVVVALAAWAQHRLHREQSGRRLAGHRHIPVKTGPGATHTTATPDRLHPSLRGPHNATQGRSYAMQDNDFSSLGTIADLLPAASICDSALIVVSGIDDDGDPAVWITTLGNPSRDDICRLARHAVTTSMHRP